ncbi:archaeosortase/exosortase family protein [Sphingomonas sp.]|jgi:exosortase|uniref:archaeosortase/exosortase family protein n=1 Tax=Sphingomonas sp. TaxID=28214 RepID=UPI002ED853E2
MTSGVVAAGSWRNWPNGGSWLCRHWFILSAAVLFAVPPFLRLARDEWTGEQGAVGPVILASGLWLMLREARGLVAEPGRTAVALWCAALLLPVFVFARVVGMLWLEWLSTYLVLVTLLYAFIGGRALARLWFPVVYLLFLVPPPYFLIAPITHSRKLWLSVTSVDLLSAIGFEAAYNGTTLYIDQYELLIADACAGMNSLISLLAIGLFYVYVLHRADWRYAAILALLTVPIAMVANLARILLLMLGTHYGGAATVAAGSILHESAGLVMFLVALGCLIGLDLMLAPLRGWLARR